MSTETTGFADGIAIIGMAGKFPGASNLDVFWENLKNGVESVTYFSEAELEFKPPAINDPNFVPARAILAEADQFDAEFFGIQPCEAQYTDPQHRLFLQTAWEALEDAGYDPERFAGSIGIFAGCSQNTYLLANLASNPQFLADYLSSQQMGAHPALLGNDKDFLTSRVAYKLNLRGPSVSVQTACSTSLVAVCQASQSLLNFQCDMALAGGVSITFPQRRGYVYEDGAIVSRDGHCRPFDASSDGTVFGDGVGLVVLKRAEEAMRDGDRIYAVIRGFAVNNDGSSKVSYMAPSVEGQAEVIAAAQAFAGISPETIGYVEAHGTGTSLGDPIEVAALTKAFQTGTSATQFCALGALKGNIGHLESAAGVAGLIKTALCLHHKELPPTLHFSAPNPRIDFAKSPFYVQSKLTPWAAGKTPRRAGASSFGVGGTNAHVVLEEAPGSESSAPASPWQLLPLSARTPEALEQMTSRLAAHLQRHSELPLADIAYTLQNGRRAFAHRRALVCRSSGEIPEIIEKKTVDRFLSHHGPAAKSRVAFLFPGQGAQQVDMGRELYEKHPLFRENVDKCCRILEPKLGLDLREALYPDDADRANAQNHLSETFLAQPALFVVEYSLAQVWLSWGVKPQIMIGHSLGEYVAACLAGVFSLEDSLHLLAARARLMQELPGGTMLAVAAAESEIAPDLSGDLELAAVNGPKSCVVSGPTEQIAALQEKLSAKNMACRALRTSHAFHSKMMEPILKTFEDLVGAVPRHLPRIPIVSTLFGKLVGDEKWIEPSYWSGQLRHTVRFGDGMGILLQESDLVLLEVGPGQTLTALARQHKERRGDAPSVHSMPRRREDSETAALLAAAGQLWLAGVEIDWTAFQAGAARRRVALPTYPFERKRHWVDSQPAAPPATSALTHGNLSASSVESLPDVFASIADDTVLSDRVIEELMDEQLRIMEQQLQALRGARNVPVERGGINA